MVPRPAWPPSRMATAIAAAASSTSRHEAAAKIFTILAPPALPLVHQQQQRRPVTTRASAHSRGVHLDTSSPSPSGPAAYEHWPPSSSSSSSSQHASSSSSSSTSPFSFPSASSSQRNRHLLRYLDEDVDVDGHFASFSLVADEHHHQQHHSDPRRQHHLDALSDADLIAHAEQMGRDQLPEEATKLLDYLCGDMRLQMSAAGGSSSSSRMLHAWRRGGDSVQRRRRAAQALLRGAAAAAPVADVAGGGVDGKEVATEGITALLSPHEVLRVFSILEEQSPQQPSAAESSKAGEEGEAREQPFSFLSSQAGQRLASKLLQSGHPTLFPVFVALFEDLQARDGGDEEALLPYPTTDTMIDAFLYALHPRVWQQQGGDAFARRAVNTLLLQSQQESGGDLAAGARDMAQLRGAGRDTRAWSAALAADEASVDLSSTAAKAPRPKDAVVFEIFCRLLVVRLCLQQGRLDQAVIKAQLREIVAAPVQLLRSSQANEATARPSASAALSAQYVLDTINNVLVHGYGSKRAVRLAVDLVGEHASLLAAKAVSLATEHSSINHNDTLIEGEHPHVLETLCRRSLEIKQSALAIKALLAVKRVSSTSSPLMSLSTLLSPGTLISLISALRLTERAGYAPSHLLELLGFQDDTIGVQEEMVLDLSPALRPAMLRALAEARVKGPLVDLWMRWTDAGCDQNSITESGGVLSAHTIAADTALMKLLVKTFAPSCATLAAAAAAAAGRSGSRSRNSSSLSDSYPSQELLSPDEGLRSSVTVPLRTRHDELSFATHVLQAFHRARTSPAEQPLFSPVTTDMATSSSTPDEQDLSSPQMYDHYDLTTLASAYLDLGREKAAFKLFGELLHRREVPDETDLLVLLYAVASRASRRMPGRSEEAAKRAVRQAYGLYERYCLSSKTKTRTSASAAAAAAAPGASSSSSVHKHLRPTPKLHATLLRMALRAGDYDLAGQLARSAKKLRFLNSGSENSNAVAGGGRGEVQTATTLFLASKAFSPIAFDERGNFATATETPTAKSSSSNGGRGMTPSHIRPVWWNLAKLAKEKVRERSWQPDAELLQHFARAAIRGRISLDEDGVATTLPTAPTTFASSRRRPRPTDNSLRSALLFLELAALQTRNIDSSLVEETLVCLQHRARSLANSRRDRATRGEWGQRVDAFVGGCLRRVEGAMKGGVAGRVRGMGAGEALSREERREVEEEEEARFDVVEEDEEGEYASEAGDGEADIDDDVNEHVTPTPRTSSSSSSSPSPTTTTTSSSSSTSHPIINPRTLRLVAGIYAELRDRSGAYQVALWLLDRRQHRQANSPLSRLSPPPPYATEEEWLSLSPQRQAVALLGRGLRKRLGQQARSERLRLETPRKGEMEEGEEGEAQWRGDGWGRERQEVQDDDASPMRIGHDEGWRHDVEGEEDADADAELDRWAEQEDHQRDKAWWRWDRRNI